MARERQALADSLRQDSESFTEFRHLLDEYGFQYEVMEYYVSVFTGERGETPDFYNQSVSSFYRLNKFLKW
jgi:hypothetical protein